jgi:hypothetical protein
LPDALRELCEERLRLFVHWPSIRPLALDFP